MSDTAEQMDAHARTAYARRVRVYWGIALFSGIAISLTSVVLEILVNRQLVPPWLHDTAIREGLLAIGGGCISLAIWLQVDYQRLSRAVQAAQPVGNQRVNLLMSVIRRVIAAILLATPIVALTLVLTRRVTGAAYDQATAVITLASVANFVWITAAFFRSLLEQGKKNSC